MKIRIIVVNVLLFLFCSSTYAGPDLTGYDIAFSDDFNGSELDGTLWKTAPLWGPYAVTNNEEQYYVDILNSNQGFSWSPFELNGGILTIKANRAGADGVPTAPDQPAESDPYWNNNPEFNYNEDYDPAGRKYLSGLISSLESFNFTHGYAETRAKLPAGQGLWPAFWQLTTKYVEDVPEIDIVEMLGQEPWKVTHSLHYFDISNNWELISTPTYETAGPDFSQDFHTYGVMWEPKKIVWYVDGVAVKTLTDADGYVIPKQAMYLISNLAVGGTWPGPADASTPFPARYDIDYIKVYRKNMPTPVTPAILDSHYQLMFEDEFEGTSIDTDKWNSSFLWGPYLHINNEEQIYIDQLGRHQNHPSKPFSVGGGTLTIKAQEILPDALPAQEPPEDPIWESYPSHQYVDTYNTSGGWVPSYTSGILTSYDEFKFVQGYAEIRAKLPSGGGLWPALWLLNGYYVGPQPEIDIMEMRGELPAEIHHSYHYFDDIGQLVSNASTHTKASGDYSSDFHNYAVEWDRDYIKWYIDGEVTHTLNTSESSKQLMYVLLNLAVGGNFVGPINANFPTQMEIDYVRVYQLKNPSDGSGTAAPPYSLPDNSWRLISVPSDAPQDINTPSDLFAEQLPGDYGTTWALFEFDAVNNEYRDVGVNGTIERGKGYWITQVSGNTVTLNLPAASAITQSQNQIGCATVDCYAHTTSGSLWYITGNPFDDSISMENVRVLTENSGGCDAGCTLAEAETNNLVYTDAIFTYDDSGYVAKQPRDPLAAWSGFWLKLGPDADGHNVKLLFSR